MPKSLQSDGGDQLRGMGGVFNSVNLGLYTYAANNPLIYVDPDGKSLLSEVLKAFIKPFLKQEAKELAKQEAKQVAKEAVKQEIKQEAKQEAKEAVKELTKQQQKAIGSLEKRIAEHEKKLQDFKDNSTVRPGMEKMSKEQIQKQQQQRIEHLQKEINTFKNNIEKVKSGELNS